MCVVQNGPMDLHSESIICPAAKKQRGGVYFWLYGIVHRMPIQQKLTPFSVTFSALPVLPAVYINLVWISCFMILNHLTSVRPLFKKSIFNGVNSDFEMWLMAIDSWLKLNNYILSLFLKQNFSWFFLWKVLRLLYRTLVRWRKTYFKSTYVYIKVT